MISNTRIGELISVPYASIILSLLLIIITTACGTDPVATESNSVLDGNGNKSTEIVVVMGSTDLVVGSNRLVFALLDNEGGFVKRESVNVFFHHIIEAEPVLKMDGTASFREWPDNRGIYVIESYFDRAGQWILQASLEMAGDAVKGSTVFEVRSVSKAPSVGSKAPLSLNKTHNTVGSMEELTTDPLPDLDLYSLTIAQALDSGKPLVVVFATPGFCRSVTCGPQVEVIKHLKSVYGNLVNFIHIEVFDNPPEMHVDINSARFSNAMIEWNLVSEPFTFVVGKDGIILGKFEGFVGKDELDLSIKAAI